MVVLQSCASPHETMRDVLSVFKSLNVQWKKIGPYNIKCIWKPQYSIPTGISSTGDCHKKTSNFSSYDAVKFEIQVPPNSFCLGIHLASRWLIS